MPDNFNKLVETFLLLCQEEESTTTVEAIRNSALQKLQNGELKTLVNSSLNGKSFSYQINAPATEIAGAATRAIRIYRGLIIRSIETDFSGI